MSKKSGPGRQYDDAYASVVRAELDGDVPFDAPGRLVSAVRCAAFAVLARPELHKRLLGRVVALLESELSADDLHTIRKDISAARNLAYDGESGKETHVTFREAARRLGVSTSTLYKWMGNADLALAPVLDEFDLGPYRIPVERLREWSRRPLEKTERDRLRDSIESDLLGYETRRQESLSAELRKVGNVLTGRDVMETAGRNQIDVSPATIRRLPAAGIDRSQRGRPRRVYDVDKAARLLARADRRRRARVARSVSTPLPTLRRLARDIPSATVLPLS